MISNNDPYTLTAYINRSFDDIKQNNACEHRPTYVVELEREEAEIRRLYAAGLEIIKQINDDDKQKCRNLYRLKVGNYGHSDLIKCRVKNHNVLVPRYIAWYDEMIKLREVLL